jgi:hypothetical protein
VGGQQPLVARGGEQAARSEIARRAELVEIFGEERVVAVVPGRALAHTGEQVGRQGHELRLRRRHGAPRARRISAR